MASVTKELDASNLDPALKSHVQKFLKTADAARFDLKNLVKCIGRNFVAKGLGHLPMVDGGCKVDHMKTELLGYRINVLSKKELMQTATSLKVKIEDEHDLKKMRGDIRREAKNDWEQFKVQADIYVSVEMQFHAIKFYWSLHAPWLTGAFVEIFPHGGSPFLGMVVGIKADVAIHEHDNSINHKDTLVFYKVIRLDEVGMEMFLTLPSWNEKDPELILNPDFKAGLAFELTLANQWLLSCPEDNVLTVIAKLTPHSCPTCDCREHCDRLQLPYKGSPDKPVIVAFSYGDGNLDSTNWGHMMYYLTRHLLRWMREHLRNKSPMRLATSAEHFKAVEQTLEQTSSPTGDPVPSSTTDSAAAASASAVEQMVQPEPSAAADPAPVSDLPAAISHQEDADQLLAEVAARAKANEEASRERALARAAEEQAKIAAAASAAAAAAAAAAPTTVAAQAVQPLPASTQANAPSDVPRTVWTLLKDLTQLKPGLYINFIYLAGSTPGQRKIITLGDALPNGKGFQFMNEEGKPRVCLTHFMLDIREASYTTAPPTAAEGEELRAYTEAEAKREVWAVMQNSRPEEQVDWLKDMTIARIQELVQELTETKETPPKSKLKQPYINWAMKHLFPVRDTTQANVDAMFARCKKRCVMWLV